MKIKLMELAPTGTRIDWWDRNRERLNEVITCFNDWQIKHSFDEFEQSVLEARIKLCREYGEKNNFSDWQFNELDEMERWIKHRED